MYEKLNPSISRPSTTKSLPG